MARQPESDALVLFGATGDLARKKIFPAVYAMQRDGRRGMPIIGVASSDLTDDDLRQRAHDAVVDSVGDDFDQSLWDDLAPRARATSAATTARRAPTRRSRRG